MAHKQSVLFQQLLAIYKKVGMSPDRTNPAGASLFLALQPFALPAVCRDDWAVDEGPQVESLEIQPRNHSTVPVVQDQHFADLHILNFEHRHQR